METWDAITARRNVRQFADQVIPDADLDHVLEAGRIAPSSQNNQPWDFIVVTDREMLRALSGVWRGGGHIATAAAAIALVIPDEEESRARERNRFDIGQATMQMMIAAADRGIGSGHSAIGDQDVARSVLGVPEDKLVAFVIDLGYPADRPLRPGTRLSAGLSTRSCTATAGDQVGASAPVFRLGPNLNRSDAVRTRQTQAPRSRQPARRSGPLALLASVGTGPPRWVRGLAGRREAVAALVDRSAGSG